MNNHIVLESWSTMRSIARQALKNNWLTVTIGYFIYYFFTAIIPTILDSYFYHVETIDLYGQSFSYIIGNFSWIYKLILTGPLQLGLILFIIEYLRTRIVNYKSLFDGFNHFLKSLGLYFLYTIFVGLGAMAFVIPGIILSFRFSQAFYILADNPDYTPMQCLKESNRLMNGNKKHFFVYEFTFLPYMIMGILPSYIVAMYISINSIPLALVLDAVLSIPLYFASTYLWVGKTVYYDLLTERLIGTKQEEQNVYY